MSFELRVKDINRTGEYTLVIQVHPDHCPVCRFSMLPRLVEGVLCDIPSESGLGCDAQLVYRCTRHECSCYFVAYYDRQTGTSAYGLRKLRPYVPRPESFSEIIKSVSDSFCNIYNDASLAEQYGLENICGTGYRKAFEFLIKDYVIRDKADEEKGKIAKMFLGKCISTYLTNSNIQEVAKRAAWLGNDETHYMRKWTNKDVQDLKRLIQLTVHWIEAEELTKEAVKDMPEEVGS
jgi:hypothetical protein